MNGLDRGLLSQWFMLKQQRPFFVAAPEELTEGVMIGAHL
jgi:hypothetical protein